MPESLRWLIGNGDTCRSDIPKEIMMERSKMQYGDEPRQSSRAGLIIRQKEPTNLEMPFDQVDSYLTPTELFYIRSHFQAPRIDLADYQLKINGAVRDPFVLSYREFCPTHPITGPGRHLLIDDDPEHWVFRCHKPAVDDGRHRAEADVRPCAGRQSKILLDDRCSIFGGNFLKPGLPPTTADNMY